MAGRARDLPDRLSCLAVTAPGLAPLAARELVALGVEPAAVGAEGVTFATSLAGLYAANLWLRTATRILVRVAEFQAGAFYQLERHAARVPWSRFVAPGVPARLRVTCRKSRLYHSDAVAERVADAVRAAQGTVAPTGADETGSGTGDDPAAAGQLVVVRMHRDRCTISIDSSGDLLHRRGYRQEGAKAPLRETLAAAVLMASGWEGRGPLLDPFCGSGTLAIEAAWLARGRAPGLDRPFAFMQWPGFASDTWRALVTEARARELGRAPVRIQASDRDAGATAAAARNAERAGASADIEVTTRALSAVEPPAGPGWLVTNPPYGVRVGDRGRLRDLYAQLGHVARARCRGWSVTLVVADRALARHTGLAGHVVLRTTNGGIPVEVVTASIP